jgi:hypothetical protein
MIRIIAVYIFQYIVADCGGQSRVITLLYYCCFIILSCQCTMYVMTSGLSTSTRRTLKSIVENIIDFPDNYITFHKILVMKVFHHFSLHFRPCILFPKDVHQCPQNYVRTSSHGLVVP